LEPPEQPTIETTRGDHSSLPLLISFNCSSLAYLEITRHVHYYRLFAPIGLEISVSLHPVCGVSRIQHLTYWAVATPAFLKKDKSCLRESRNQTLHLTQIPSIEWNRTSSGESCWPK